MTKEYFFSHFSKNFFGSMFVIVFSSFIFSGCEENQPNTVRNFKLDKYLGAWYEIARTDNPFERGCERGVARYEMLPNGNVSVNNSCILQNGKLKVAKGIAKFATKDHTIGMLKVSFFRPFYGQYNIRMLAKDYSFAVVTSKRNKYAWILSRTPTLDQSALFSIMKFLESIGIESDKLYFPKQDIKEIMPKIQNQ